MSKTVDVSISPYIPLSPNPSSVMPVNGFFGIYIKYNNKENTVKKDNAYEAPIITISGFVKEKGNASGVFNTSDEFATFVDGLQFDDTEMAEKWTISKADEKNELKIIYTKATPLKDNFACSFHSIKCNPTNLKGDDSRAILSVKAEYFKTDMMDEYEISAQKIYITDIISFVANRASVEINEDITLTWNCRGDYVNSVELQINNEEPQTLGVIGDLTTQITHPTVFKLTAQNYNPNARFSASSYISLGMIPPSVETFTSDKEYVFHKEKVELQWNASSAYCCQINGEKERYLPQDRIWVTPDFTSSHSTKLANYKLTAYGYDGQVPFTVYKELKLKRSFWEEVGGIKGIALSGVKKCQPKGMYVAHNKTYIFEGKAIYASEDGLTYQQVSILPMEEGYTLNAEYKSGFCNGKFYVAGVQSGDHIYMACYDTQKAEWTTTWVSEIGSRFLNGCFACYTSKQFLYYAFFVEKTFYIFKENNEDSGSWSIIAHYKTEHTILAGDCCFRGDALYLALQCENQEIRNYYLSVNKEGVLDCLKEGYVIKAEEESISLVSAYHHIFVLGKSAIYNVENGRKADICYEERLFTGNGEEPVMICRTEDGSKLYKLHAKEM